MAINEKQLEAIKEFFGDEEVDADWLKEHIGIKFDDFSKTATIEIHDMNEQEFEWLKPANPISPSN